MLTREQCQLLAQLHAKAVKRARLWQALTYGSPKKLAAELIYAKTEQDFAEALSSLTEH